METTKFPAVQFKRSMKVGATPGAADLEEGELAINAVDGKIFSKDTQGRIIQLGYGVSGNDSDELFYLDENNEVYATSVSKKTISVYTDSSSEGWKNAPAVQAAEAGTEIKVVRDAGNAAGWGAIYSTNSETGNWTAFNHHSVATGGMGGIQVTMLHNHVEGGSSLYGGNNLNNCASAFRPHASNGTFDHYRGSKGSGITSGGLAILIADKPIKINSSPTDSNIGIGHIRAGPWDQFPPTPRLEFGHWRDLTIDYLDSDGVLIYRDVHNDIPDAQRITLYGPPGDSDQIPGLVKTIVVRGENGFTQNGWPCQICDMFWYTDPSNSRSYINGTSQRDAFFYKNPDATDGTFVAGRLKFISSATTQLSSNPENMLNGSAQISLSTAIDHSYLINFHKQWGIGAGSFINGTPSNGNYFQDVGFKYYNANNEVVYDETKSYTDLQARRMPSHKTVAKIELSLENATGAASLNGFLPQLVQPTDSDGTFDIVTEPEIWIKGSGLASAPTGTYIYNGSEGDTITTWIRTYNYVES